MRKSLEETWAYLEAKGEDPPRRLDGQPFVPEAMPSHDDDELGLSFFKSRLRAADYSNLTLPRTFFGRSEVIRVSFASCDLSGSRMCWNDFEDCDFSGADLTGSDLRASLFKRCRFAGAILRDVDLRQSSFEDCDFSEAEMQGAVSQKDRLATHLSLEQREVMIWTSNEGPVPPGG